MKPPVAAIETNQTTNFFHADIFSVPLGASHFGKSLPIRSKLQASRLQSLDRKAVIYGILAA